MDPVGLIEKERLRLIPKSHQASHEFCWYVYEQLAQMLIQHDASGASRVVSNSFRSIAAESGDVLSEADFIEFLKERGFNSECRHHLISNLSLALTADMLRFLHEGLRTIENCHISIAFSLLRKPFKENLLFLAWLLGDEVEFLRRFSSNNYETLNGLGEAEQIKILEDAISKTITPDLFSPRDIRDAIFSKQLETGLEPLWQRATHLITRQGRLLKTPDYSINFIFEPARSEHYYDVLYSWLPIIFLLIFQVTLECFRLALKVNETTASHYLITTVGCYEALFLHESDATIKDMVNSVFSSFLKCCRCDNKLLINQSNAPRLYMLEQIYCTRCGCDSQIPLYWLMSYAKVKADRKGIQFHLNKEEIDNDSDIG